MKQIAPHIYVEDRYRGVTVGCIVADSGVICIDSPMLPSDARRWREQIAKLSNKPVRFTVLTDANRERILGLQHLGGAVVAHEAAWEKIKSYGDAFRQQAVDSVSPCDATAAAEIASDLRIVVPQVTFTSTLTLYQGDTPVVIRHVGGVTPGSLWVHLPKQGVLFAGDLVTSHAHPLTAEADIDVWLDLLDQIRDAGFPAKAIVPGRGSTCTKAALKPLAVYLRAMRTRVQSLIRLRRQKSETATLIPEFLSRYPVPSDDRECAQRRIKAGLDHIYDALKSKK
jgi:glyoxylase-like metal-dependent hydrolase (beta-lactamase superfamily II)